MTQDLRTGVSRDQAVAHWRKVLAMRGLPPISYQYAREALEVLHATEEAAPARVPGADDE